MNNKNSNKLLWIVIILTVVMVGVGLGSKVLVDKVADRVIQKLQKEYSPSPYGPGIDPDKLDPEKLRKGPAGPPITNPPATKVTQPTTGGWDGEWEKQRK
jgi:hypothetical protein